MHTIAPRRASSATQSKVPRYIMIGGFLGAGKTTAVAKLARRLTDQGLKVGLITNDQGCNLVDTAMLRAKGFATEEIPGGCFCCRFDSLVDASRNLKDKEAPDVFIAEPVGSCTDLVATVTSPMRRLYAKNFQIAPFSVLVDPVRARRIFGLDKGRSFSDKVLYIYHKQLEEADIIVISKSDLLTAKQLDELRSAISNKHPHAEVIVASSRAEHNLDEWMERLTGAGQATRSTMEVDYDIYADGEALLGWLNCTVHLAAKKDINADKLLKKLAAEIQKRLKAKKAEIAHLKMTLSPSESQNNIAVANLVRNDFVPEVSLTLDKPFRAGQLIINLRAETAPATLGQTVREALSATEKAFPTLKAMLDHLEHFRPGRPTPTHRDVRSSAQSRI